MPPTFTRSLATLALAAGLLGAAGCAAVDSLPAPGPRRFTVALWGDMPYVRPGTPDTETSRIGPLIDDINAAKVDFTIFDGDIKSGSSLCDDAAYTQAAGFFRRFDAPMVYVPGDNEWTDCHRKNNGGYDPVERLAHLRKTLHASPSSFGRRPMPLERQGAPGGEYAENMRWSYGGVMFLGLNVPGSNNNLVKPGECLDSKSARTRKDCDAANAEYVARDLANIAFLRESFAKARAQRAPGVMVVIQADPGFDLPETESVDERGQPGFEGYDFFLDALAKETAGFDGQVVLVHGDTHFFKIDKPLYSPARMLKNFTRVQTFGSPNLHWVRVHVDPASRAVFTFEPMIVSGP